MLKTPEKLFPALSVCKKNSYFFPLAGDVVE
jgi:hypothetical protein